MFDGIAPGEPGDTCAVARAAALRRRQPVTIPGVGAYGAAMASTCNSRPLVAELLLDDGRYAMVCKRQSFDEMIAGECPATDWKTA